MPKPPKPPGVPSQPRTKGRQPKATLGELSRRQPSYEESVAVYNKHVEGEPLIMVILGHSYIEHQLDVLLRRAFKNPDDTVWAELISPHGPLSTFMSKIISAKALKIIDDVTADHLNRVRNIRNTFAHAKILIDFDMPEVAKEIRGARLPEKKYRERYGWIKKARSEKVSAKHAFRLLCYAAALAIMNRRIRANNTTMQNYKRSYQRNSLKELAMALQAPAGQSFGSGLSQLNQTVSPKPPKSPEGAPALLGLLEIHNDNEGT